VSVCIPHVGPIAADDEFRAARADVTATGELAIRVPAEADVSGDFTVRVRFRRSRSAGLSSGLYWRGRGERGCMAVGRNEGIRMWLPCVDAAGELCAWRLKLRVQEGNVAVAPGRLVRQYVYEKDAAWRVFEYDCSHVRVASPQVAFVAGPYVPVPVPDLPAVLALVPARCVPLCASTLHALPSLVRFCADYFDTPFPHPTFTLVFADDFPSRPDETSGIVTTPGMVVVSSELLHAVGDVDATSVAVRVLARCVASQWSGCCLATQTDVDAWLPRAIAGYVVGLYERETRGVNWFRDNSRLEQDVLFERQAREVAPRPLADSSAEHPWARERLGIADIKGPMVVYMLERRMSAEKLRTCVRRVVRQAVAEHGALLVAKDFFEACQEEANVAMGEMERMWVHRALAPEFTCGHWYGKRRHQTTMVMRQEVPDITDRYKGLMTVRVYEFEGSHDEVVHIHALYHVWDITCLSDLRKGTKRALPLAGGEQVMVDLSKCDFSPILWVRVDPDGDFIKRYTHNQTAYGWVFQLQLDKDVTAQVEALHALWRLRPRGIGVAIETTMRDPRAYWGVVREACVSLARHSHTENGFYGQTALLKFVREKFYVDGHVREHDFSDLGEYMLQCSLPHALSLLRNADGLSPREVLPMLCDMLQYSEARVGASSDAWWLASVVRAAVACPTRQLEDVRVVERHITRLLSLERVVPSHGQVLSCACVESLAQLMVLGHIQPDPWRLWAYVMPTSPAASSSRGRESNGVALRVCALGAWLRVVWSLACLVKTNQHAWGALQAAAGAVKTARNGSDNVGGRVEMEMAPPAPPVGEGQSKAAFVVAVVDVIEQLAHLPANGDGTQTRILTAGLTDFARLIREGDAEKARHAAALKERLRGMPGNHPDTHRLADIVWGNMCGAAYAGRMDVREAWRALWIGLFGIERPYGAPTDASNDDVTYARSDDDVDAAQAAALEAQVVENDGELAREATQARVESLEQRRAIHIHGPPKVHVSMFVNPNAVRYGDTGEKLILLERKRGYRRVGGVILRRSKTKKKGGAKKKRKTASKKKKAAPKRRKRAARSDSSDEEDSESSSEGMLFMCVFVCVCVCLWGGGW
jgi:hypothetical protein